MDVAETLVRMDELGAVNLIPTLRTAFRWGKCPIPETGYTLVCNKGSRDDPRFGIVPRTQAERSVP